MKGGAGMEEQNIKALFTSQLEVANVGVELFYQACLLYTSDAADE